MRKILLILGLTVLFASNFASAQTAEVKQGISNPYLSSTQADNIVRLSIDQLAAFLSSEADDIVRLSLEQLTALSEAKIDDIVRLSLGKLEGLSRAEIDDIVRLSIDQLATLPVANLIVLSGKISFALKESFKLKEVIQPSGKEG